MLEGLYHLVLEWKTKQTTCQKNLPYLEKSQVPNTKGTIWQSTHVARRLGRRYICPKSCSSLSESHRFIDSHGRNCFLPQIPSVTNRKLIAIQGLNKLFTSPLGLAALAISRDTITHARHSTHPFQSLAYPRPFVRGSLPAFAFLVQV